jgi:hypothetical protein
MFNFYDFLFIKFFFTAVIQTQTKNKSKLMHWKASKQRVLKQLEEQLNKYKNFGNLDVYFSVSY